MRYGFGLLAFLIVAAIIFTLWTYHTKEVIETAKPAREMAQRLSGHDEDGTAAKDTIKLEAFPPDGKMKGLRVVDVIPDGQMDRAYGFHKNDLIVEAEMDFRDIDAALAKDMVLSAFTKSKPITVIRGGERITLPLPPGSNTQTSSQQNPQPSTNQPAPPPKDTRSALQRQLENVSQPR